MDENEYIDLIYKKAKEKNFALISMVMCPICEMYDKPLRPLVLDLPFSHDGKGFKGLVLFVCKDCKTVKTKTLYENLIFWLRTKTAVLHI